MVVEAEGDDLVHSDGKTAKKACELLAKYAKQKMPFFLGVGFVRPVYRLWHQKNIIHPFSLTLK